MRKIFTLLLSLLTLSIMANPINKKLAEQIAVNQYKNYAAASISDFSVISSFENSFEGITTFYTFNFKSGGFMIIAADDASIPVLAYSFEGAVDPEIYNPAAAQWLENYSRAIVDISKSKASNMQTRPMWDKILYNQLPKSILDVPEFVTTRWDQGCYYNALCPLESGAGYGTCGHAWTGCVATTMSVIMKYHQWPINGIGYHSYTHPDYGVQTADFSATTYNWAAMPNSVSAANAAVATIMYHAGVSVNMQYSADGSGAFSEDVPFALVNYFNYDAACHLEAKDNYPVIEDWYALLRNELDGLNPVYYAGSSTASGGHAWICDGYRLSDNKFHFNWGWSGSYNGYFAIGALNPGSYNFNEQNRIIVGAVPGNNTTSWIVQNTHFTTASRGINYIHAVNENVAWAMSYDGSGSNATTNDFARTIDGGRTWIPGDVIGGSTYGVGNICGLDENIAYVTLYNGSGNQNNTCGIYKTINGGNTWSQLTGALQGSASFANNVFFWNELEGMCHGDVRDGYFEIYTTTNGGTSWTRVPQASITGGTAASGEGGWTSVIETVGDSTIMFGTNKGKVYISDDRGFHWHITNANITPATNGGINMIAFTDADHGIVAQTISPISYRKTSDGGATWETFTPNGPFFTNGLTSVPGSDGIYVSTGAAQGATGASYSTDFGLNWNLFPATDSKQFLATDFFSNSVGYAGGFNTDQNNDGMFRMIGTLGIAPGAQITTDPVEITSILAPEESDTVAMTITNPGDAPLDWNITLDGSPVWLSVDPAQGVTPVGESSIVNVLFNTSELSRANYYSNLIITNNSTNSPVLQVPVTLTFTIGNEFIETANGVSIFPNPVSEELRINSANVIMNFSIFNLSGSLVKESKVNAKDYSVNVAEIPSGLYILRLTTANGIINKKINVR